MMTTSLKQSKSYWDQRAKEEKKWQELAKKDIDKYNQHIVGLYNSAISDINKQIKSDIAFSGGNLVKAEDMKEYEMLAKRAVAKANALRAQGKSVTRKDFSEDVNRRLKVYNATMRINRNEILKSKIGARLVELGVDQEGSLTNKLWNDYTKEKERQAGILGITTKSNLWTSKEVQEQIAGQIAGANFSKRIWADMDGLKGQLDGLVSSAIIRGESPVEMAKRLTGMVSSTVMDQEYAAERLARTEIARVQFAAQKKSIIDTGYKYVKWIAEADACRTCREIAYKDNGYDEDGVYKAKEVPDIPVHPNCMCSISAHWVDENLLNGEDKQQDEETSTDNESISNLKEFKQAVSKLGISEVKSLNKLDPAMLSRIYETISGEFEQQPQLKGFLTTIKGGYRPKSSDVAYVQSKLVYVSGTYDDPKYKFYAELNLNQAKLNDVDAANKMVDKAVRDHWWSKKTDYTGIIKHEMAHAINNRAIYAEVFDNKSIRLLSHDDANGLAKALRKNKLAKEILLETFKNIGVELTEENIEKYISGYGRTKIGEAFAELYSDESQSEFTKEFRKVLSSRLKEVFKS